MELWHFNIDLVRADNFVCLLLLLHCFFFVTNTTEFITIAAIWIVSFIFPYTVYLFESLLFCLVFDRVFCWLLFFSVNFKRVASFNYFFNLTWIFFMSFLASFIAVFHMQYWVIRKSFWKQTTIITLSVQAPPIQQTITLYCPIQILRGLGI